MQELAGRLKGTRMNGALGLGEATGVGQASDEEGSTAMHKGYLSPFG
jgi:hypothetical protein